MDFYEGRDSNNYEVYKESVFNKELTQAFLWMFVGLMLSGVTAYTVATSFAMYLSKGMLMVCAIAEFVLVLLLSFRLKKMSHTLALVTFISYSILNGVTLSTLFLVYNIGSIVTAFIFSALFFAVMAVYGMVTKKDLSRIGNILFCGLISFLIVSILSMFVKIDEFDVVLSYIGIAIFSGLTAFDIQKIKNIHKYNGGLVGSNISIYAALTIYLDFINIFLRVVKILGNKSISKND